MKDQTTFEAQDIDRLKGITKMYSWGIINTKIISKEVEVVELKWDDNQKQIHVKYCENGIVYPGYFNQHVFLTPEEAVRGKLKSLAKLVVTYRHTVELILQNIQLNCAVHHINYTEFKNENHL